MDINSTREEETALIVVPDTDIMTAFTGEFSAYFSPRIEKLRDRVSAFQRVDRDPARVENREEIKAFARKLVRTRTTIEATGKALADRLKALPKKNDENRRLVKSAIEELEAEVLAPVDDWEAKEKARIDAHLWKIADITNLPAANQAGELLTEEVIMARMKRVDEIAPTGAAREEFADEYERAQRMAIAALGRALTARMAYDADQAELAALRKREAERAAQEAEWKAAEEAERAAKDAIERQARADAEAETRRAQERAAAAERGVLRRLKEQADADAAREGAERRRLEAEVAERRAADAKAAEDKRIAEAKAEQERLAAERKAQNTRHRANVNRAAAEAITELLVRDGFADATDGGSIAKAIVTAIAKSEIPSVRIEY